MVEDKDAIAVVEALSREGLRNLKLESRVHVLEIALRGLYDDNIDYLRLNNLGGFDNHWLVAARKALGLPPGSVADTGEKL